MIIENLNLKAFGRFTDTQLDLSAGPQRFHLVYGPNESGKSTCLRAISSLLFGFPTRTIDSYLHGNAKLRVGATFVDESGQRLQVIRRKNGKTKLHAEDDSTPVDPAQLEQMLGGIDEPTFHHRFGLSHEQLVAGGKAVLDSKGELGEILFAAGAGVGRLNAIRAQLDGESKELFLERGKKTINLLLRTLEEKRKELRELQTLPAEYRTLKAQLAEAEERAQSLNNQIATENRSLAKRKAFRSGLDIVPIWRREKKRLQALSSVPTLDEDFVARRREASANRGTYQKLVADLRHEIEATTKQLESCPIDPATIEHEKEIVALFQAIATRQSASKDQEHLVRIVANKNRHLRNLLRDLDVHVDEDAPQEEIDQAVDRLHISDATQIRINELAGDFEMLRRLERDSLESLQTLRKQLVDLDDEIERNPAAGDPSIIDAVLSEIGPPTALIDQAEREQAECRELESECENLVRKLRIKELALEQVVQIDVPSTSQIEDSEQLLSDRRRILEDCGKQLSNLRERKQEALEKLNRLQSDQPLPTEQQLHQSREQRDEQVDQLQSVRQDQAAFLSLTQSVRKSIRAADSVVDTMRSHQQQVALRASVSAELTQLENEIASVQQSVTDAAAGVDEAQSQWNQLWESNQIHAAPPREMREWITTHRTLIDKFALLQKSQAQWELARNRIQRSSDRLVAALQGAWSARPVAAGIEESDSRTTEPLSLEALHDRASMLRDELDATVTATQNLTRRRNEIHNAIPAAEARYEANVLKRKQWDQDWEQAVKTFSGDQEAGPNVVSTRLKKVGELFQETRERDIVIGRIRSIDDDERSFTSRVSAMAKLVGVNLGENSSSLDLAQTLYERLQTAKSAAKELDALRRNIEQRKKKLDSDSQLLAVANTQLAELCREAGVESAEDLPVVEQQSVEKRAVAAAYTNAENQLTLIAVGEPLETFAEETETLDAVELDSEISLLESSLQSLNQQWSSALEKVGGLKKELDAIDGGDRAAELNQELQLLSGRIERESQHYARLRIASMMLQQSIEHYRTENESPVLKLACQAFETLTCGRYRGLRPEYDDKGHSKLFGVQQTATGEEQLVPVEAMSLGTADALYLAMRLASLEHQLAAGRAIPVVIDDCLIQLDDQRTVAAMKLLSNLSRRTQVILFTHHQHLIELAEAELQSGDYHLHRLAS